MGSLSPGWHSMLLLPPLLKLPQVPGPQPWTPPHSVSHLLELNLLFRLLEGGVSVVMLKQNSHGRQHFPCPALSMT